MRQRSGRMGSIFSDFSPAQPATVAMNRTPLKNAIDSRIKRVNGSPPNG